MKNKMIKLIICCVVLALFLLLAVYSFIKANKIDSTINVNNNVDIKDDNNVVDDNEENNNEPIEDNENNEDTNKVDDKKEEIKDNPKNNDSKKNNNVDNNKNSEDNKKDPIVDTSPNDYKIINGGNYNIEGNYHCVSINTNSEVTLNLSNVNIKCDNGPGINIESNNKVNINISGTNTISSKTNEELDGAIYSKGILTFNGSGTLTINSNIDGIASSKKILFKSGKYIVNSEDDGIRSKDNLEFSGSNIIIKTLGDGIKSNNKEDDSKGFIVINSGTFNINSSGDALDSSNYITINRGTFNIKTKDGYNEKSETSAKGIKADKKITINNGSLTFNTSDDAIHSNGNLIINNGNINIQTSDDAIHGEYNVDIINGNININKSYEGIEGQVITVKGGIININADDDGINAVHPTLGTKDTSFSGKVLFSGGITKIKSMGDGIDSNGSIEIKSGEVYVESFSGNAETSLDHDKELKISGGTLVSVSKIVGKDPHGEMISTIPMLVAYVDGSGDISLGKISFKTVLPNYKMVVIASDKLEVGDNTFTYGDKQVNLKLENKVSIYENKDNRRR